MEPVVELLRLLLDDAAPFVDHLDGGRTLVWIHPDNHPHECTSLPQPISNSKEGTATSSRTTPF
jgi:hypothetical protein